ncbi:MAG: ABC-2 family transporter protein [Tenericutes bacterium ADurb.Bin239]|jgi:hypothetical protein|nr:MAG: ABC-2 family transporter protein [Tenericutes bacterium ADurb.Bin239]
MKNLLVADFRRIFKGKGIYILMGLAFVFPALTALVMYLSGLVADLTEVGDLLIDFYNPLTFYSSSFNPTSNIGLVLLIVVTVVLSGEFTNNTIRNKIVAGHSKLNMFLSSLILVLTYVFVIMFIHSSSTYLFNSIIFGFGKSPFVEFLKRGLVAYSGVFVLYTALTLLTYHFKNLIGPLGIILGVYFVLMMVSTYMFVANEGEGLKAKFLFYLFPFLYLGGTAAPKNVEWLWATLTNISYLVVLPAFGLVLAKRTDYK